MLKRLWNQLVFCCSNEVLIGENGFIDGDTMQQVPAVSSRRRRRRVGGLFSSVAVGDGKYKESARSAVTMSHRQYITGPG